ncbi:MAG: hypothetical protein V4495_14995 [Pseudomonadota bacterium]
MNRYKNYRKTCSTEHQNQGKATFVIRQSQIYPCKSHLVPARLADPIACPGISDISAIVVQKRQLIFMKQKIKKTIAFGFSTTYAGGRTSQTTIWRQEYASLPVDTSADIEVVAVVEVTAVAPTLRMETHPCQQSSRPSLSIHP